MRAFMRAIGLGGLFRRSAAASTATTATAGSSINTAGSFRVITLEQFEKMTTTAPTDNTAAFEARRSSRYSSIVERPQFLFFCGSDTSAFPSGELPPTYGTTLASRVAAANILEQPAIDQHMPVFFRPPLSPTNPGC